MSDFRETIKQLSNTPEQYEQQLMKEQAAQKAIEFCNTLKNAIRDRANRGLYQVCGENRIIKIYFNYSYGILYGDDNNYFKCLSNHYSYDCQYPYCSANHLSGMEFNAGMVESRDDYISRLDFYQNKFFGGVKWKTTTTLSLAGITFLSTLRDRLVEDGIEISHFWNVVYNDWHYEYHHEKWSYIRDEMLLALFHDLCKRENGIKYRMVIGRESRKTVYRP